MTRWFCVLPCSLMDADIVAFGPEGMKPADLLGVAQEWPKIKIEKRFVRGTVMDKKPRFRADIDIRNKWRRSKSIHIGKGVRVFWMPNSSKLKGVGR